MGAQFPDLDRILAGANAKDMQGTLIIFGGVREDQEQNVVDYRLIDHNIAGYGPEVARGIIRLLDDDQSILEDARIILRRVGNVVSATTYIKILLNLRKIITLQGGPHRVEHKHQYARLLLRLKEELEVLPFENVHCTDNFLNPVHYDECIHELIGDMTLSWMRFRNDAVVYVVKAIGPYQEFLQNLAEQLNGQ